jgi:hypothetical protein
LLEPLLEKSLLGDPDREDPGELYGDVTTELGELELGDGIPRLITGALEDNLSSWTIGDNPKCEMVSLCC